MMTVKLHDKSEQGYKTLKPRLQSGDHLTRDQFERIYHLHPEIKKAELIEGVVFVASPVYLPHSYFHGRITTWAGVYEGLTPIVMFADNLSVRLDLDNEVQPDVALWYIDGQATAPENTYLEGAPDLVIEVAASTAQYDLHSKKNVYRRRTGVREYVVLIVNEKRTEWSVAQEGKFVEVVPENDVYKSQVFPGLWFDSAAFWREDTKQLLAVLQQGMTAD